MTALQAARERLRVYVEEELPRYLAEAPWYEVPNIRRERLKHLLNEVERAAMHLAQSGKPF